jgi:hypothetical protein
MKLSWRDRAHVTILSALIAGGGAMVPARWLGWSPPARKAAMIGAGWVALGLILPWAMKAPDRPHNILLVRNGLARTSLGGRALRVLEIVVVGAFLWALLY